MSPHTQGMGSEAYEIFLKEREIVLSKSIKKTPQQLVKVFFMSPFFTFCQKPLLQSPSRFSTPLDTSDFDDRRVSILTSIRFRVLIFV